MGSRAPSHAPTPLQLSLGHRQQSISSWRGLRAFPIAFHFVACEETEGLRALSRSRVTQRMKGCVDLEFGSPAWHCPPQPAPLTSPSLEKSRAWWGRGTDTSMERKCGPPPAPGTTAFFGACLLLRACTVYWHQHGVWNFLDTRDQRLMHGAALTQRKCFSDSADNSRGKEHTHRHTQQIHRHTETTQTHTHKQTYKDAHRHTQQMHKQTLRDNTDTYTDAHRHTKTHTGTHRHEHTHRHITDIHRDRYTHSAHTDTQRHQHERHTHEHTDAHTDAHAYPPLFPARSPWRSKALTELLLVSPQVEGDAGAGQRDTQRLVLEGVT